MTKKGGEALAAASIQTGTREGIVIGTSQESFAVCCGVNTMVSEDKYLASTNYGGDRGKKGLWLARKCAARAKDRQTRFPDHIKVDHVLTAANY